jgi:hypothetical protein
MNKTLIVGLIMALNSTNSFAEMRPYIGMSVNIFSINSSELNASDPSIGFNFTSSEETRDSGSTSGISGGIIINDNSKINFSTFSGKEKDSSFMTATVTSVSYDYAFNGSGIHKGWFLGGGFSSVEIEAEETNSTTAGTAKETGAMFRGGYEYLFDNNLFLEVGINVHLAEIDLKFNGKGSASNLEFTSTMDVSNSYITLSYAF